MAQDFVGSNNIPLLAKDGQFGSRLHLGKDAANGRYIFTKMTPLTRLLFPEDDDELYPYTLDDGDRVEPDYYVPILPMILVNGCRTGIGSGWSCNVPLYNPIRLVTCVHTWLDRESSVFVLPPLIPFYHGFRGRIEALSDTKFRTHGIIEEDKTEGRRKKASETHRITEIPVDVSIDRYKESMERLLEEKKIKSFKNYSSPNQAVFAFTPADGFQPSEENLNLTSDISITNMVLFTDQGKLQKYETLTDIFEVYCKKRFEIYTRRKAHLIARLESLLHKEQLRSRFLEDVITGRVEVFRKKEDEILRQLQRLGYPTEDDLAFLLTIPLRQFTVEALTTLQEKIRILEADYRQLQETTEAQMWKREIDRLLPLLSSSS
jgi:DNA topoisomerase-2